MWHSEGPMKMSPNLTSYQMGWTISERFPPSSCGSWSAENICFAFFSHLAWVFFFFPPVDSHYIKISEFSWISISENKQGEFFFFSSPTLCAGIFIIFLLLLVKLAEKGKKPDIVSSPKILKLARSLFIQVMRWVGLPKTVGLCSIQRAVTQDKRAKPSPIQIFIKMTGGRPATLGSGTVMSEQRQRKGSKHINSMENLRICQANIDV